MKQFSTLRSLPERKRIPLRPDPIPLIRRLRRMTTSVWALAWTTIPLVPLTRTEATWPPPPSNGNSFGDGDGAVTGRIEGINFAPRGGLGNSAGKGLTRRRAATGVSVVSNARYPGPASLSAGETGPQ